MLFCSMENPGLRVSWIAHLLYCFYQSVRAVFTTTSNLRLSRCFCLAEIPKAQLSAKKALQVVSSYLSVPSKPPPAYSLLGFDARSAETLSTEFYQIPPICVVPNFGHDDLYKVLAGPTVKILDRFDYHSILYFLLMKLRTALESAWLNNFPELRKVGLLGLSIFFIFFLFLSFGSWKVMYTVTFLSCAVLRKRHIAS